MIEIVSNNHSNEMIKFLEKQGGEIYNDKENYKKISSTKIESNNDSLIL